MSLTYRRFIGPEAAPVLDAFAALRITVFRDWPYLYDGDLAYERRYLQPYTSAHAILVGAFDGTDLVGASTGMPLTEHADAFGAAFAGTAIDPADVFYCSESILLPEFRGQGAGRVFFDEREAHARTLGLRCACFAAVIRPETHPARPATYRPLDAMWRSFGYEPLDGITATYAWKDIGDSAESEKPMQAWIKRL